MKNKKVVCSNCKYHQLLTGADWELDQCRKIIDWKYNKIRKSPVFNDIELSNLNNDCEHYEENITVTEKWFSGIGRFFTKKTKEEDD